MIKPKKLLLPLILGLLLGFVSGAITLTLLVSYRFDEHHQRIKQLESIINEKDIKLAKLQDSINKNKLVLKDIEIMLTSKEDEFLQDKMAQITLKKLIDEKYHPLLGKDIKTIDYDMIPEVIENRIMLIDNKEYKLKVSKVILYDVLKIWVTVTKV